MSCPFQCNNCSQLVIHPEQRFNFFSDYSQMVSCPSCGAQEAHFCKNINVYLRREEAEQVRNKGGSTNKFGTSWI